MGAGQTEGLDKQVPIQIVLCVLYYICNPNPTQPEDTHMGIEILDPQYTSQQDAAPTLARAVRNFNATKRTTIQVMADLRTLQDRGAHIVYGQTNFATWATQQFDGLQRSNVLQLTRCGGVLLELQRRGVIDIDRGAPIGATALRELSVVANTYGNDKMVEVCTTALSMVEERDITESTVKSALKLLMPPAPSNLDIPESLDGEETEDDLAEADDESDDGMSKSLRERIDYVRDLSYDLPDTIQQLSTELVSLRRELRQEPRPEDRQWLESGR